MLTHDVNGRAYARYDDLKPGDKVQVDGGFDCMDADEVKTVMANHTGKYVLCEQGFHFLDGQCDDGEHCVGVYKVTE